MRDHYGVASLHEMLDLGCTDHHRRVLLDEGLLIPMHRSVYRLASTPATLEGRCRAVCLEHLPAVVTGRAAGKLRGLRLMGLVARIDVLIGYGAKSFVDPGVCQRRCPPLLVDEVVARRDGIRLTSPARMAFDLAARMSAIHLESVIEQILDLQLCTMTELHAVDRRLFASARPGAKRFRDVIGLRGDGAAADSDDEVVLHDALRAAGVIGLIRQHPITRPDGKRSFVDLAVPELRWAIEVDHSDFHAGRVASQADKERDRQLTMLGWLTSRVTQDDVRQRLNKTVSELIAIYRHRQRPAS